MKANKISQVSDSYDELRREFENLVCKRRGIPTDRWADSGKYRYEYTQMRWEDFQAAYIAGLRSARESCAYMSSQGYTLVTAVRELNARISELET